MTTQPETAISVARLGRTYKVYPKPGALLREVFTGRKQHELYHALTDISFTVARGECVGVIGPNGAGKSTLLKIIAGTLPPTTGEIEVRGRISAILELGTGFHPEYSGRDNVYLGGMCLGMNREQVQRKFDWIVEFSELGEAIDKPFKTYSSGMQARLTFATAISIDPEILIIDEALAAGDAYFVVKCGKRIREICDSGATVFFVSHSTHQVATLCSRAIWIENGRMRDMGPAIDICRRYDYAVHERISGGVGRTIDIADTVEHLSREEERPDGAAEAVGVAPAEIGGGPSVAAAAEIDIESLRAPGNLAARGLDGGDGVETVGLETLHGEIFRKGPARIVKVEFLDGQERPVQRLRAWDTFIIRVHYACDRPEELQGSLGLAIGIHRKTDNLLVAQFSTVNPPRDEDMLSYDKAAFRLPSGHSGVIEARFQNFELLAGDYLLSFGILPNEPGTSEFYEYHHYRYLLTVLRNGYPSGAIFYPHVEWRHERDQPVVSMVKNDRKERASR